MSMKPDSALFAAIADDYTGGSDLAGMLSERGVRTVQILGLQPHEFVTALRDYQAVVVSLKSRSLPAAEACALSLQALSQLRQLNARQLQFKYCSTFDSTPQGNIGPVIDSLMEALDTGFTIAVPALPVNGRTQYLGHLFVGMQLLAESHMRHHPITPMADSNLVRHLQAQTQRKVGLVGHLAVRSGVAAIRQECARLQSEGVAVALVDAICDADLSAIAEAALDLPLITGGSGLAMALPAVWAGKGWFSLPQRTESPRSGEEQEPVLMISGSCSAVTLTQIESLRGSGCVLLPLDIRRLLVRGSEAEIALLWPQVQHAIRSWTPVMVFSSASAAEREQVLRKAEADGWFAEKIHLLIEQALAGLARKAVEEGLSRRLIVAGGETSGAVMDALKVQAVEVVGAIDPGVPCLKSVCGQPLALALKSGNFGSPDFFMKASRLLSKIPLLDEGLL